MRYYCQLLSYYGKKESRLQAFDGWSLQPVGHMTAVSYRPFMEMRLHTNITYEKIDFRYSRIEFVSTIVYRFAFTNTGISFSAR